MQRGMKHRQTLATFVTTWILFMSLFLFAHIVVAPLVLAASGNTTTSAESEASEGIVGIFVGVVNFISNKIKEITNYKPETWQTSSIEKIDDTIPQFNLNPEPSSFPVYTTHSANTTADIAKILAYHGAHFNADQIDAMIQIARETRGQIDPSKLPRLTFSTASANGGFINSTPVPVSAPLSEAPRQLYEIQTWTNGPMSILAGQSFPITVYWRAVLWDEDWTTPLLVSPIYEQRVSIPGSNHPSAQCVNVYKGTINIPPEFGVTQATFYHWYETYTILPAQAYSAPRGVGRPTNCSIRSIYPNENFVIDLTAAEFELLVRLVQAEAAIDGYEGMLAVAASIVQRVKFQGADFSTRNSLAEIIYQPGQYSPITNGHIHKYTAYGENDELARRAVLQALRGDPGPLPFKQFGNVSMLPMYFYNPDEVKNNDEVKCFFRTLDFAKKVGHHAFYFHNEMQKHERDALCDYWKKYNPYGELIPEERRDQCDVDKRRGIEANPEKNPRYTYWCNLEAKGI